MQFSDRSSFPQRSVTTKWTNYSNVKMKPRNDLVEVFASFLQFKDSGTAWISQLKLRRSMERCLSCNENTPTDDNFWSLYWHKVWCDLGEAEALRDRPPSQAREHLYAYLQETAYWAAYCVADKSELSQKWDKLPEYFQILWQNQTGDRVIKKLNKALISWIETQKVHDFNKDNRVTAVDILLKEWLQNYYANLRN